MRRLLNGLLWILGSLLVIALGLRALVLDVWTLPDDAVLGASVLPTLAAGDTVLVLTRGTPGFGELVRCPDPDEAGQYIVGRIVGLPGDTVEVDGHNLAVNGTKYDAESACADPKFTFKDPASGRDLEANCDVVTMGSGRHLRGVGRRAPLERAQRFEVRPDTVMLLSDNRNLHDDSRDFGLQPRTACKQRVVFRLWSKQGWIDEDHRLSLVR
jgi:signal peptidase I